MAMSKRLGKRAGEEKLTLRLERRAFRLDMGGGGPSEAEGEFILLDSWLPMPLERMGTFSSKERKLTKGARLRTEVELRTSRTLLSFPSFWLELGGVNLALQGHPCTICQPPPSYFAHGFQRPALWHLSKALSTEKDARDITEVIQRERGSERTYIFYSPNIILSLLDLYSSPATFQILTAPSPPVLATLCPFPTQQTPFTPSL